MKYFWNLIILRIIDLKKKIMLIILNGFKYKLKI